MLPLHDVMPMIPWYEDISTWYNMMRLYDATLLIWYDDNSRWCFMMRLYDATLMIWYDDNSRWYYMMRLHDAMLMIWCDDISTWCHIFCCIFCSIYTTIWCCDDTMLWRWHDDAMIFPHDVTYFVTYFFDWYNDMMLRLYYAIMVWCYDDTWWVHSEQVGPREEQSEPHLMHFQGLYLPS